MFVLNVLAFVLIGMQLRPIWARLDGAVRLHYSPVAAAVLGAVILTRIVWVMSYNTVLRLTIARRGFHPRRPMALPTVQGGIVISWCGHARHRHAGRRLRAAGRLSASRPHPADGVCRGAGFAGDPGPDAAAADLGAASEGRDPVATEVGRARAIAYRAALDEIDGDPSEEAEILRLEYRALLLRAESDPDGGVSSSELPADPLRRRAIAAARRSILALRQSEDIGDDAFHMLEEELDWAELSAQG